MEKLKKKLKTTDKIYNREETNVNYVKINRSRS